MKRIIQTGDIARGLLNSKRPHRGNGLSTLFGAIFLGISLVFSGCSLQEDTFDLKVRTGVADATGTITGKVIDGATRAPIARAELTLIVNGDKRTEKSSNSNDPDLTGTFAFSGVPAGSHTLKVSVDGYAVYQILVSVNQTSDNTPLTANLGLVALAKAFNLVVVTTDLGVPVAGVTVFAEPDGISDDCSKNAGNTPIFGDVFGDASTSGEIHEISAVTDANGNATLVGLNQCFEYLIVAAPHDGNADGAYDHVTASIFFDGATDSDKTVSLALNRAERDDTIVVVARSTDRNQTQGANMRTITDTGNSSLGSFGPVLSTVSTTPFKIVFNYPVSLSGGMTVSTNNFLVNPDLNNDNVIDGSDAAYSDPVILNAPASLDSTGTILTITPPTGGFPKNETIELDGSVTANIDGQVSTEILDNFFYVADGSATGLSATTTVTADNYNGSSTGGAASTVFLEFPEYVSGTFRVISITEGTTVTEINDPTNAFGIFSGEIVYTDGTLATAVPPCAGCGTSAGIFYRVSTGQSLANGDKIKIAFDVADAEGNRLSKEVELTVE